MPNLDDNRTIITGPQVGDSAHGDFVSSSSFFGHTLPEGTHVAEFEVKGLIGEGGFGIVYLAYDPSLQRHVALKEYMPASLAARASGGVEVKVKSERHRETFKAGLKSFVNEARLLARFDHRALVKVYRFWEANGTAYMVMPYYEGPTLKRTLAELTEPPDEDDLRAWLDPLLDALAVMHQAHCFHRDIAPDNILLTPTGPLLLDFGAARHVIGDMTQALTVVLKPGYAPIEQYGEVAAMAQGAWTDLYALASVVYCAITGQAPMSSVERLMSDTLVPLSVQAAGRFNPRFLSAIDAALALRPKDRPQDVAAFRRLLDEPPAVVMPPIAPVPAAVRVPAPVRVMAPEPSTAPAPLPPSPAVVVAATPVVEPPHAPSTRTTLPLPATVTYVGEPIPPVDLELSAGFGRAATARSAIDEFMAPSPPRRASRNWLPLAGAAALLAGLAATPLLFTSTPTHETPAAEPVAAPAVSVTPAAPAATTGTVSEPVITAEPASAVAPTVIAAPVVVVAPAASPVVAPTVQPAAAEPVAAPATEPPAAVARPTVKAAPPIAAAKPAARAAKTVDEPPAERPARTEAPPPKSRAESQQCSDILQKASLEALNDEEKAYLRKECK